MVSEFAVMEHRDGREEVQILLPAPVPLYGIPHPGIARVAKGAWRFWRSLSVKDLGGAIRLPSIRFGIGAKLKREICARANRSDLLTVRDDSSGN
jgi:hypothetical protein